MSNFLKWMLGLFLFLCIGLLGFMLSRVPDTEGFVTSTTQSHEFIKNIYSMYIHNKITASAAVSIISDYLKTVSEDSAMIPIREIMGIDVVNITDSERMSQLREELNKPIIMANATEARAVEANATEANATEANATEARATEANATEENATEEKAKESKLEEVKEMIATVPEPIASTSVVPIVPADRTMSLTDASFPTTISPVVPVVSDSTKLPLIPTSAITSEQLKESFRSRYVKAKENYKPRY